MELARKLVKQLKKLSFQIIEMFKLAPGAS